MIAKNEVPQPKFELGDVVATPGALEALQQTGEDGSAYLRRHQTGDWGDLCDEDRKANDTALTTGERILSSYKTSNGTKLWILTEAGRSATTILLPSEY